MKKGKNTKQTGAALAIAIIMVAILAVISLTALAFASSEARIAGSELQRTQTFYATAASLEIMTNSFSDLFLKKMRPTPGDLNTIATTQPTALTTEGFTFLQTLTEDNDKLTQMRTMQGLPNTVYPRVNIPEGSFSGLYATIVPYKISSTGTYRTGTQVKLEREFNNYLVPLFQFGVFSNDDMEISPGPQTTFNGRIHSNQNIFALSNTKFLNRVTMAGELVRDAVSSGVSNTLSGKPNVVIQVGLINVAIEDGSVRSSGSTVGGPNILGSSAGSRGFYPGRPNGIANTAWDSTSTLTATGTPGRFGGQLLTGSTGATQLKLPLQLGGNSNAELIKRSLPSDGEILSTSRYHTKAQIRILIDDETAGSGASNVAGIPAGKGVLLSAFDPIPLNGGNALRNISDTGSFTQPNFKQIDPLSNITDAMTVRGIKNTGATVGGNYIPPGSGLTGKILIEVVKPDGTTIDVTTAILSMGMTQGEPNGIVYLQRPMFTSFLQGSRDRAGNGLDLVNLTKNYRFLADGEIAVDPTSYLDSLGFLDTTIATLDDDTSATATRAATPSTWFENIVPINVYNVREGWYRNDLDENNVYERGMTSVVEINMHNLARWVDGIYNANLLAGTNAVSTNIKDQEEGFVVFVSDRRGDKPKTEYLEDATAYLSTNGIVDNEDIYGPNSTLDEGEDVIDFGWDSNFGGASKKGILQKDITELPDTGTTWTPTATSLDRAKTVLAWNNPNIFRRAVRLFDSETLSFTAAAGKLSNTKGITIATENMLYTWGNVNTTGITSIPSGGSTLNDGGYTGAQVPMSLVCDAIFPLSKTWFDGLSVMYPEGTSLPRAYSGVAHRQADANATAITQSTSIRAAIIAGATKTAMNTNPGRNTIGSRRSGGIVNFPRFLEIWNLTTQSPFNYSGSMIVLYNSTQAMSQWENDTSVIYTPPLRNWSFDETFLNPSKLPPGTPFFQYLQATNFRQNLKN